MLPPSAGDSLNLLPAGGEVLSYRAGQTSMPPGAARPPLGWGMAVLPPLVAIACWPVFFVIFFVMSFTLALVAVAMCLVWAWSVSSRISTWRYWQRVRAVAEGSAPDPRAGYRGRVRALLFAAQAVVIVSSCPLFWLALNIARQHGIAPQGLWMGHRLL